MDAKQIIDVMGGRAEVMRITGLTKGRISQMVKENHIPVAWMVAFRAMKPSAFGVASPRRRTKKESSHA